MTELGDAETARRARRGAEPHADVTVGFSGSNGMPFLLQVIWARSSAASATFPVKRFFRNRPA